MGNGYDFECCLLIILPENNPLWYLITSFLLNDKSGYT